MSTEDEAECYCDFIQTIVDNGYEITAHHVIPDDGAGHVPDASCPCGPDIEWHETDMVVIDHLDQDLEPTIVQAVVA